MNRDYSLLIQFDLHLSKNTNTIFTREEINEILNKITLTNFEKKFCFDFFLKNSILVYDPYINNYYYSLEKIEKYKPYPNYKKMIELIKSDTCIELDFINLKIN